MINALIALTLISLYNKTNGHLRVIRLVEYDLIIPSKVSMPTFVFFVKQKTCLVSDPKRFQFLADNASLKVCWLHGHF